MFTVYSAAFSREEVTRTATRSFVQRVFGGVLRPFLASFAEEMSPEEVEVLKTELARIERAHAKKDKRT